MASSRNTMPSLAALLGLLAVAGYQNRDKLGQIFQDAKGRAPNSGGILGELGKMFGDPGKVRSAKAWENLSMRSRTVGTGRRQTPG